MFKMLYKPHVKVIDRYIYDLSWRDQVTRTYSRSFFVNVLCVNPKLVEFKVARVHEYDIHMLAPSLTMWYFYCLYVNVLQKLIFVSHIAKSKPCLIDCQQRFSSISLGSFCMNTTDNNKQQPRKQQETTESHNNKPGAMTTQQKSNTFRNLCSSIVSNNKVSNVQNASVTNKNELVANNANSGPSPLTSVPVILCGFMQGDFFGSNFSLPQTSNCVEPRDSELYNRAQYLEPRLLASVHDKRGNSVREGRCRFGGLTIGGGGSVGGVARNRGGCAESGYSCSNLIDTPVVENCCIRTNCMYSYCGKNNFWNEVLCPLQYSNCVETMLEHKFYTVYVPENKTNLISVCWCVFTTN